MDRFSGIITALVTAFDSEGRVDVRAMKQSVRHQIGAGIAGFCALGGTGEPLSMSLDEQRAAIDAVLDANAGERPVIVGGLGGDIREVTAIARHAHAGGAAALMLIPPYFVNTRPRHTRTYFERIAEASPIPLVIYHGPGRSGVRMDAEELCRIIEAIPSVVAVKETSGSITLLLEAMQMTVRPVAWLQGFDELILPTLAAGGQGAIVSLGGLIPATLTEICRLHSEGRMDEARELQLSILPLCRHIYSEPNPGPLKLALRLAGRPSGRTRLPICDPEPETAVALEKMLPALLGREEELRARG